MSARLERMRKIEGIARRANIELFGGAANLQSLIMDIEAADCHIPLDLTRFHAAQHFEFAHDISGIKRHIDRQTGKLQNCFLPLCALPEDAPRPPGLPALPSWLGPFQ